MSPLLERIVRDTRKRLEERKRKEPLEELKRRLADAPPARSLQDALRGRFSVIAEHKRRSPSAGQMQAANLEECLAVYAETPWISAVSVLTDVDHFSGAPGDLQAARRRCPDKPLLRKDFIIDEYQVVEARVLGADAILLMAVLFAGEPARMRQLYEQATELGLDVLCEIGMGADESGDALARIVPAEAPLWGINSRKFGGKLGVRDGRDLLVDTARHKTLRGLVPDGKIAVAESGIHTAADLGAARAAGYDAALIGTAFLQGPESVREVVAEMGRAFERDEEARGTRAATPA